MKTIWTMEEKGIFRSADSAFTDRIEMAGRHIAAIVTYGVDENGRPILSRELCYPRLRLRPRNTHATLHAHHKTETQEILLDGQPVSERVTQFRFDGVLSCSGTEKSGRLKIERCLFPCPDVSAYMEHLAVTNASDAPAEVSVAAVRNAEYIFGAAGVYAIESACEALERVLAPGETLTSDLIFSARLVTEPEIHPDGEEQLAARRNLVSLLCDGSLNLECPDEELRQFFRLAKLRAAESIYDTIEGPLHSPGGGPYYAAVWTNDQVEYAAPFFPFMGYERANHASLNAFDLFARFMSSAMLPIPSSVIDEGRDYWNGAGDRGDAAMYLYGCARCLLALGDMEEARRRFWTLKWAADFCLSRRTAQGVIASDSDELEGRIPSGDANLCTSSLTCGGLESAAAIADELGYGELAKEWRQESKALRGSIESHFGATVSGYPTYRYYDGNDVLRSWICIPLSMGIYDRKDGTADALLSDRLFREDGVLSVEGDRIFWDRSTLYSFRGILNANAADRIYPFIQTYVNQRLRGEHVPYAVEAYPEGDQRHLSAESALFCRVITEGFCGMTPVGLNKIEIHPSIPEKLGRMTLKKIHACGGCFDLELVRQPEATRICMTHADGRSETAVVPLGGSMTVQI
ncbi:MAG: hypothetical protein IJO98_05860 [Clostridia bacterium]|nr:hypothetical protein [Clostridia bacterium]